MLGYKIVESCNGQLGSYSRKRGSLKNTWVYGGIRYRVGKYVRPKKNCGPLCVYDTLQHAKKNILLSVDKIYKCKYAPAEGNVVWAGGYKKTVDELNCPGTQLAKAVRLIRRVYP